MHTKQVGDKYIINTRTNYYHKPVYSLNWKWNLDENSSLSTTFYGSKGRGGGTGPMNTRDTYMGDNFAEVNGTWIDTVGGDTSDSYYKYFNPAELDDKLEGLTGHKLLLTIKDGQLIQLLILLTAQQ